MRNLLLITTDQMRGDHLGCAGHPVLFGHTDTAADPRTLVEDDPRLHDRQGIMPGFDVELELKRDNASWFDWLEERGHILPDDARDIYLPASGTPGPANNQPPVYPTSETETAFVTEKFIEWLTTSAQTDWFAHVSFARPRPPFIVPAPFNTLYQPQDMIEVISGWWTNKKSAPHPMVSYLRDRATQDQYVHGAQGPMHDWTRSQLAALRETYCGMISEIDAQIGRLLDALKQTGAWDDTLIVFTADHGEHLGDHGLMGTGGFYHQSCHIPLIIRDPAHRSSRGQTCTHFTEASDIMPTASEAFEVNALQPLDGKPLAEFLTGGTPSDWRDEVHWEFNFREITSRDAQLIFGLQAEDCKLTVLRDDKFKYVHFNGLPALFFDLTRDPNEERNVAGVQNYAADHIRYAEKMLSWRDRHLERELTTIEITDYGPVGFKQSLFLKGGICAPTAPN
jgi:arylsulfatase A-like enzyme